MSPEVSACVAGADDPIHDVVIMGGGLAGLTLALQLRRRMPDLDVVIVERRRHPVPAAAHKVGESSVEIAAWYFGRELGLEDYLLEHQLKKFGFRFFFSDRAARIDQVTELGASTFLPTPSYQIDRGLFENELARRAVGLGCRFIDGATIRRFSLAEGRGRRGAGEHDLHAVEFDRGGHTERLRSRWLIDAGGRAGLVKRKLGLAEENGHESGAVWFRIATRIDVDDWSTDDDWRGRCDPPHRWLSTIHLVGEGYWVWLIPLASGSHSVGIVADGRQHPIESLDTFHKAMRWLEIHQPQLHRVLHAHRDRLQDFAYFRRFSYGCRQVFCGRSRWALTGEAGVFLDPFYSPGSDFIAIANSQITELIALDRSQGPVQMAARLAEQVFFSLYRNMLPLYVDQYRIFGDARVLPVKVIWDYTFYWGILCPLVIQKRILDLPLMARLQTRLEGIERLNVAVQRVLRDWSRDRGAAGDSPPVMLDQAALDWFARLNAGLLDPLDEAGFDRCIAQSCDRLNALAREIVECVRGDRVGVDTAAVTELLPPDTRSQALLFAAIARPPADPVSAVRPPPRRPEVLPLEHD